MTLHDFISRLHFADDVTLDACLLAGFVDMGGGYVAYRNPYDCLYIAGNLKTRKIFDAGRLNAPKYIDLDASNDAIPCDVEIFERLILDNHLSHLFERRKHDHICSA